MLTLKALFSYAIMTPNSEIHSDKANRQFLGNIKVVHALSQILLSRKLCVTKCGLIVSHHIVWFVDRGNLKTKNNKTKLTNKNP